MPEVTGPAGGRSGRLAHGVGAQEDVDRGRDVGLIIHLSASTNLSPYPNAKTLVCTVEEAIRVTRQGASDLGDV